MSQTRNGGKLLQNGDVIKVKGSLAYKRVQFNNDDGSVVVRIYLEGEEATLVIGITKDGKGPFVVHRKNNGNEGRKPITVSL